MTATRRPFPAARRFVVRAMRAGRAASPMHGLVQIDLTDPLAQIEERDHLAATGEHLARFRETVLNAPSAGRR